jgi:NitT/TauT family transport system substrate-binding protein
MAITRRRFVQLAGATVAAAATPGLARAADPVKLRLGYLPITDHLTIIAAGREPFRTLALEPVKFASWPELAEAVKGGAVQAAFALTPIGLALRARGAPIKLVALGHRNGSVLTVAPEISAAADLKGKAIAIPSRFSTHNLLLRRYLRAAGLDADRDVKLVELAPPEMLNALSTRRIAAYIVAEPFGAQAELKGVGKVLALSKDIWPDHICCALLAREDLIAARPDAVQELVSALVAAGGFAQAHRDEAAALSKRYLGQDPKVVLHVLTTPPGRVTYDDLVPTLADLKATQDDLLKYRIASAQVDLPAFLDDRFVCAAPAGSR